MDPLLADIRNCQTCARFLPHGCRPILAAHPESRIVLVSQAPGRIAHEKHIAWKDPSGNRLRDWMGVRESIFYDPQQVAILPMGFCYPGKGKAGDLPPRPECAPLWHEAVWSQMTQVRLTLLIGQYAQQYYLPRHARQTLTQRVRNYARYLPDFFPLPHPSPRNNIWLRKNPWFEEEVLPALKQRIAGVLKR